MPTPRTTWTSYEPRSAPAIKSKNVLSPIGYRAPSVRANALLDATPPAPIARIAEEFFCGVALLALALGPSASRTTREAHCSSTFLAQGPAARGPLRTGTPHRRPAPRRLNPGALPMGVRSPGTTSLAAAAARHGRKRLQDCSWSEYAGFAMRPEADRLPGGPALSLRVAPTTVPL